jgi:lipopolysaccharide transport system ATP-binding protein
MDAPVIEVKNVFKKYLLERGGVSLRDSLIDSARRSLRFFVRGENVRAEKCFWALNDVSFSVRRGQVLGLIGRNGAGKTTLLSILSRITCPTRGEISIRGRTTSLLQVGTGFHPELTGRENIYFNGSILGMKKREIDRKLDEIIAFAEIGEFIDIPVKKFSSGMRFRLAFAIAAHLETEILLLDEVLAGGDAAFRKKCVAKIGDTAGKGGTVIFVTHDISAAENLCESSLLLERGRLVMHDKTPEVVREYLSGAHFPEQNSLEKPELAKEGNGFARFVRVELFDRAGRKLQSVTEGEPFIVSLGLRAYRDIEARVISATFTNQWGNDILTTRHFDSLNIDRLPEGAYDFNVLIDPNPFVRGIVGMRLVCLGPDLLKYDHVREAFSFAVAKNSRSREITGWRPGVVNIPFGWEMAGKR